ncbi:pirin family protein [Sphingomonas bacterium]|uniref:pirin family protein n=1 Tax=Sphingomonas bacterium TaxID=1895847 RepID=UPI001575FC10|nr:pirin family protein [Sphingomonas bacterium]
MSDVQPHRPVVRICAPDAARHGDAFDALRIGKAMFGAEADPFLNVDHFRMTGPTFPPHPHAGFSAVTYVLPESVNGMRNRDSRGDRSLIPPGGLHWTAAGSGIVHEEVPDRPGIVTEGMQIFIRQPVAQEEAPAVIHHVEADQIPTAALPEGGWMRLLAGSFETLVAPFEAPSALVLLDLELAPDANFDWPDTSPEPSSPRSRPDGLAIYLFEGALDLGEGYGSRRLVKAPNLIVFARGAGRVSVRAIDAHARLLQVTARSCYPLRRDWRMRRAAITRAKWAGWHHSDQLRRCWIHVR